MKSEPGPPMTLGAAAAAGVRLIVWCRESGHQIEPDPCSPGSAGLMRPLSTVELEGPRLIAEKEPCHACQLAHEHKAGSYSAEYI